MARRFRYLRAQPLGVHSYRRVTGTRSLLLVGLAFVLGVMLGFNIKDVMIRTCGGLTIGNGFGGTDCNEDQRFAFLEATERPPPVFTKLPDRFLANITRHSIAKKYILRPHKYLENNQSRYFMTFLVKSTSFLIERRFLIRQTWGAIESINGYKFGVIFVIGNMTTVEEQDLLKEESDLYGDILQSDVADDYVSLPLKVLSSMQWVSQEFGNRSDYFVTTDDDCYVNSRVTVDYFSKDMARKLPNIHCGFVYNKASQPIRKKSKYQVDETVYPADAYPTFCHGGMTVMSFGTLNALYRTAEVTDLGGFHLEDVLITGILRQKTYNHSENVEPVKYSRIREYNQSPEKMVWHLGMTKKLHLAFAVRWRHARRGMRLKTDRKDSEKEPSADYFSGVVTSPPSLPGMPLNRTMTHFSTRWRALRPRGRYTSQIRPHLPLFRSRPEDSQKAQRSSREGAADKPPREQAAKKISIKIIKPDNET